MVQSDEALALKTLKGDLEAFEELVNRYQKPVFKIAYRMVGQREEAEDVCQEIFLTVYQKMHQFDPAKKFSPWLYKVAVNTSISRLRRKKKVVLLNFDDPSSRQIEYMHSELDDPLLHIEQEQLRQELSEALLKMPEGYRAMIILRYQLDLTNGEIAEALSMNKENVEVKMHRARKLLRKILLETVAEGRLLYELRPGK